MEADAELEVEDDDIEDFGRYTMNDLQDDDGEGSLLILSIFTYLNVGCKDENMNLILTL